MEPEAIRMLLLFAISIAVTLLFSDLRHDLRSAESANITLMHLMPSNPYARYLGQEVMAKVYEQSEWERCVVVAVSHHGSVCVRRADDMGTKGRWIHHALACGRVKSIEVDE